MEIDIKGNLKIRCNCCNKIYNIESESFMEDITYEEGGMDTRVLHEYRDRFNCDKCGTHLSYDYMVSEYVGTIEFVRTDAHNCTVIEEPMACISIYEFFFDEDERLVVQENAYSALDLIEEVINNPKRMNEISPTEFEKLVADVFNRLGYDVKLTERSGDGGVDVYATKSIDGLNFMLVIQCKQYALTRKVGVGIVRELFATQTDMQANKAVLVTSSFFTRGAKEYAEEHKELISLIDGEELIKMIKGM